MIDVGKILFTSPPPTTNTLLFLICHASINEPPPSISGNFSSPICIDIEVINDVHNCQFFIGDCSVLYYECKSLVTYCAISKWNPVHRTGGVTDKAQLRLTLLRTFETTVTEWTRRMDGKSQGTDKFSINRCLELPRFWGIILIISIYLQSCPVENWEVEEFWVPESHWHLLPLQRNNEILVSSLHQKVLSHWVRIIQHLL